jgi:hypothetical protein
MEKNPGMIFQIKDGGKCIAYNKKQDKAFGDRLLINHVDDNYEPIKDEATGKNLVGLKSKELLTLIGYVD